MRKNKASVRVISTITSALMIVLALGIVVGIDMFTYDFGDYDKFSTGQYWTSFGMLTASVLLFFFAISRLIIDKKEDKDENLQNKLDGIDDAVNSTGLIGCDDFLEKYYIDKKEKKLRDIYQTHIDRIRNKADRFGFNLNTDDISYIEADRKRFLRKRTDIEIYNDLKDEYTKWRHKLEDPKLRDIAASKKLKSVYRVKRALLSDGVEQSFAGDEDKPVNKSKYAVKEAGAKIAMAVAFSFFLASMVIDSFNGNKFSDPEFLMYLGIRLGVFAFQGFNGVKYGLSYFRDIIIGTAIIRENVLSKYLTWKKDKDKALALEEKVRLELEAVQIIEDEPIIIEQPVDKTEIKDEGVETVNEINTN